MNWNAIGIRLGLAFLLVTVLTLAGGSALFFLTQAAYSSGISPSPVVEPRKGARGFIGLPSVDTISVQNAYSSSASVEIAYVEFGGQVTATISSQLPAATARVYAKPPEFAGFATISTSLPVQVVNFTLDEWGSEAYLAHSSSDVGNSRFTIPFLVKEFEGWDTRFSLQNLGTGPISMVITFYESDSSKPISESYSFGVGEAILIDLAENEILPDGFIGSATVASNQPFVFATSVQLYDEERNLRASYAVGNEEIEGSLNVPALFNGWDLQTSQLCLVNTEPFTVDFHVEYTDKVVVQERNVRPFGSYCFQQKDELHIDGWVGGATVKATGPASRPVSFSAMVIVDAVDQERLIGRWAYTPANYKPFEAPFGLAFPLLYNDYQDWTTAIHVTNPNEFSAAIAPYYSAHSGFMPCVEPFTLEPGETRTLVQSELPVQFDVGSAFFTSTLPLVAVVAATSHKALGETDRHFGYNAAYLTEADTSSQECDEIMDPLFEPADNQYRSYQRGYYMEINAPELWNNGLTGIDNTNPVTIAVIDTGVDLDHPDLVDNLVPGYDFVDDDTEPQDTSRDSHGTKVAGVIAAKMNNDWAEGKATGVVGIGGGNAISDVQGLRIMPLRVSAQSTTVDCTVAAMAIDYATVHGANIINLSYGSYESCEDEKAAIKRAYAAGVAIVAGAGNANRNAPFFPAAYGSDENMDLVIAVAGVEASGIKAYASNYGHWIDFAAPYNQIRSLTNDGGYGSDSGTSFSAPMVSGLLGVLMSNFGWQRDTAVRVLHETADDVDQINEIQHRGLLGSGRINAGNASESRLFSVYIPVVASGEY